MTFRRMVLLAHLTMGLAAAAFLFIEGLSGTVLALRPELEALLLDHRPSDRVAETGKALPMSKLFPLLERAYPGRKVGVLRFRPPGHAWVATLVSAPRGGKPVPVAFDPATGKVMYEPSLTASGVRKPIVVVLIFLARLHGNFLGNGIGRQVIGWAAVAMLGLALSGLVLWWPYWRFWPRRGHGAADAAFNLHATTGFYASAFVVVFAVTTIGMEWPRQSIALVSCFIPASPVTAMAAVSEPPGHGPGGVAHTRPVAGLKPDAQHPLDPDELLRRAEAEVPGHTPFAIQFYARARPAFIVQFLGRPGELPGMVSLDPITGRVLRMRAPQPLSAAERFVVRTMHKVHTGEIWGAPSRYVAGAIGLALAALAVTGPLIFFLRRKRTIAPTE